MKEIIEQHGIWVSIGTVVLCLNVILTALKTVLDKLEEMLTPIPDPANPDKIKKLSLLIGKVCGWLSKILDWTSANKEHK